MAPRKNAKSGINSTTLSISYGLQNKVQAALILFHLYKLVDLYVKHFIFLLIKSQIIFILIQILSLVTGPLDWSKSGGSNSLDRYRAIGTNNSYHVQQYEEPGIHIPPGVRTAKIIRTVRQSRV